MYLFVELIDSNLVVVERETDLLVTYIIVDIGIGSDFHTYCHYRFDDVEFHFEQSFVVCIFVKNGESVIAAHLQLATLVGNTELIVGIEHGGIDGVAIIFDGIIVESIEPIAFKNILRSAPVSFTVF